MHARARLSPEGELYTCLFGNRGHDLRKLVRSEKTDDEIAAFVQRVWSRRNGPLLRAAGVGDGGACEAGDVVHRGLSVAQTNRLSHLDAAGRPRMVDVSAKPDTAREAMAKGSVYMSAETLALIASGSAAKGDVLTTAQIAGIMAAKRTHGADPALPPDLAMYQPHPSPEPTRL